MSKPSTSLENPQKKASNASVLQHHLSRRSVLIGGAAVAATLAIPQSIVASSTSTMEITSRSKPQGDTVNTLIVKDGTSIYYKDWGTGQPVVFCHGWPLSADAWDAQMLFLGQQGYRVVAHDRRGHGRSSQPWDGNDMITTRTILLNSSKN